MEDRKAERLAELVRRESFEWGNDVAEPYHGRAALDMNRQWSTIIWPILSINDIDFSVTMDFACGYGRNARKLKEVGAQTITLVDVNLDNIAVCDTRLVALGGYETFCNNGYDLDGIPSGKYTHVYSFDAMVHFDIEIVMSYITEFARVLKPGGTAFVHHSNFTGSPGSSFKSNPCLRNFMSAAIFRHIAIQNGFDMLEQKVIDWGGVKALDCLTLMRRRHPQHTA
jgi:ubiquinone/menaquinone biosynthesis C-methylase UbiE